VVAVSFDLTFLREIAIAGGWLLWAVDGWESKRLSTDAIQLLKRCLSEPSSSAHHASEQDQEDFAASTSAIDRGSTVLPQLPAAASLLLVEWKVPLCAANCLIFVPNPTARRAEPEDKNQGKQ
jgi:hypothetical protein